MRGNFDQRFVQDLLPDLPIVPVLGDPNHHTAITRTAEILTRIADHSSKIAPNLFRHASTLRRSGIAHIEVGIRIATNSRIDSLAMVR